VLSVVLWGIGDMAERGLNRWMSWIKRAFPSRKRSWGGETEEAWREWFTRWLALYRICHFTDAYTACHEFVVKHPWLLKMDFVCVRLAELELLGNQDSGRALELLDKAKEQGFSDAIRYYCVRSIAESQEGLREASKCSCAEYVGLEPDLHFMKWVAICLSDRGDDRALSICELILEKEPGYCGVFICKARYALRAGDYGIAILFTKRAERLKPETMEVHQIARLYHDLGEFNEAIAAYHIAWNHGYEPKGVLFAGISACYHCIGDRVAAKRYAKWALRHDPDEEYVKKIWDEVSRDHGDSR